MKKSLGTPPHLHDTRNSISHPETAPVKLDRRTLRKTGRDTQLNIAVSISFRDEFNRAARADRLTSWQMLAAAMKAYHQLSKEEKNRIIEEVVSADPAAHYVSR
jgi:hypothetical protein